MQLFSFEIEGRCGALTKEQRKKRGHPFQGGLSDTVSAVYITRPWLGHV
jgi:hypothetical protein